MTKLFNSAKVVLGVTNRDDVGSALIIEVNIESDVDCANVSSVVDSNGAEWS